MYSLSRIKSTWMIPSHLITNACVLPLLFKKDALLLSRWFWIIFSYDAIIFYCQLCSPEYGFCSIRNIKIMNRLKCLTLTDGKTRTTSVKLHGLAHTQFMRFEWMQLILTLELTTVKKCNEGKKNDPTLQIHTQL